MDATNEILKEYDGIYCPASPSTAPLFTSSSDRLSNEYLIANNYLAIGNFAGLPSITIPLGFSFNMPFGVNLTCGAFNESKTLNIANKIEELIGIKNVVTKENN